MRTIVRKALRSFGYDVVKTAQMNVDNDILKDDDFMELYTQCKPYTMTSPARMYALYTAVNYVVDNDIPGDLVECGVWRGGSSMLMALTLLRRGVSDRQLYLYDTFEGMSKPEAGIDVTVDTEEDAQGKFEETALSEDSSDWCYADIQEVTANMKRTGYPAHLVQYVKGKVEDTLPQTLPGPTALLRLDTDWYQSTKQELVHLYPLLADKGVLIIDDYGHWQGCRQAVDEYFGGKTHFLHRIDRAGRLLIKGA